MRPGDLPCPPPPWTTARHEAGENTGQGAVIGLYVEQRCRLSRQEKSLSPGFHISDPTTRGSYPTRSGLSALGPGGPGTGILAGFRSSGRYTQQKAATCSDSAGAATGQLSMQNSADRKGDIDGEEAGSRNATTVEHAGGADQRALQ